MSNVYFVRMNEMKDGYYDSYRDAFYLAELSGYPLIWLDEVDPDSDNTYILTPLNGSWQHGWQNPKARLIWWDIEWRLKEDGYQWTSAELDAPPGVSEWWVSDEWYASIIAQRYPAVKFVPFGSHAGLVQNEAPSETHFDVATLSCQSQDGGRQHMIDLLNQEGLTLAPNVWNPDRDKILKNTGAMLHIHQWRKVKTIAPLRFAIAAAYGLPLISEQVEHRGMFDNIVLFSEYDAMPAYAKTLTGRYQAELREKGRALHDLLCNEYSFRKCVEAAL